MDPYELSALVSAVAIAIARSTPNNKELAALSLAFIQISSTLEAIIAQRALLEKQENPAANQTEINNGANLIFEQPIII
jgi:hypothetical protein